MVHVPFAGSRIRALNAVMSGTVRLRRLTTVPFAKPQQQRRHRFAALAITGTARDPVLSESADLAGSPACPVTVHGVLRAAGDRRTRRSRSWHDCARKWPRSPNEAAVVGAVQRHRISGGFNSTAMPIAEIILKDLAQWRDVAKAANIRIDY